MPQERLRSVVYRSFVTCDDPKGVAECKKTIKKSKHKTPNQKQLQIMEVSRGADKLKQIVQNHPSAHDLLQGALHLQDSLFLLTKLQQASNGMTTEGGQFPRSSTSSLPSARRLDCYDELREAIRESFARQKINLMPGKEGSSHSSGGSSSRHEKPRSPNLIAKLMGLGEVPSGRGNSLVFKRDGEMEKEKFSSLVGIDLLRPKKEGRKVEEMIERMEYKGLLGRKNLFNNVEDPPIVIMKPLHQKIIKSTTILKPQNVREVQVPRARKKKPHKYTPNNIYIGDRVPAANKNHHKPPVPRLQKKQSVIREKIDDTNTRKGEEAKATKDLGKKLSTLKRESHVSKAQIADQKESIKGASIKSNIPNKNLGKKVKPKSKPSASIVESVKSGVNIESNIQGSLVKDTAEEVINICSNVSMADNACESSELIGKGDANDENCAPHFPDESRDPKSRTDTRHLLLSSSSFLNHVEEELYDTGMCVFSSDDTDKERVDDSPLLDCAKELVSRKSLRSRNARMVSPSSLILLDEKSIQELVGEISDGIECLRKYSTSCGDVLEDSIYPMLERDLRENEEVNGAWDLGWRRDGYTMEAIKEVVYDIEKLMLREFVSDLVVEFWKNCK